MDTPQKDDEDRSIIEVDGQTVIDESDYVYVLPVMVDDDKILIKHQAAPGESSRLITMVGGEIGDDDSPEQVIPDILREAGLKLQDHGTTAHLDNVALYPGTTRRVDIFVLEVYDYEQGPPDDESMFELVDAEDLTSTVVESETDIFGELIYLLLSEVYR